jgi:TfoX/Sxy family transcriptional regulator of competence genes
VERINTNQTSGIDMASDLNFVEYVVDQFEPDCAITYKRMFGEFGLYSDGKFFAMICDDRLFFKPTEGGRAFMENVVEAPPYPGARLALLIEDQIEDGEWLSELARITARELPEPKKKKPKKKR